MHVGLNAQLLDFSQTYRSGGISRYIYHLLVELRALESEDRFSVFVGRLPVDSALAPTPSFRLRSVGLPTARPAVRVLWEQVLHPGVLQRENVEVCWLRSLLLLPGSLTVIVTTFTEVLPV